MQSISTGEPTVYATPASTHGEGLRNVLLNFPFRDGYIVQTFERTFFIKHKTFFVNCIINMLMNRILQLVSEAYLYQNL